MLLVVVNLAGAGEAGPREHEEAEQRDQEYPPTADDHAPAGLELPPEFIGGRRSRLDGSGGLHLRAGGDGGHGKWILGEESSFIISPECYVPADLAVTSMRGSTKT